jgi:hypothetical protein
MPKDIRADNMTRHLQEYSNKFKADLKLMVRHLSQLEIRFLQVIWYQDRQLKT